MGFSRQGYWSGLPFPSPGDLPDPAMGPGSPTLQMDSFLSEPPGMVASCLSCSRWGLLLRCVGFSLVVVPSLQSLGAQQLQHMGLAAP